MFGRLLLLETAGVVVNEHNKLRIDLKENSYDIIIQHGLLSNLGILISQKFAKPKTFIVTDNNISVHWLEQTIESLSAQGISPKVLEVPAGENTKSFINLEKIIDQLLESKVDRDSLLIALGGGVIGDLAGFAGAVTLRGIKVVQVPTTLLSQVDSSVGGKTGINVRQGKNLVGSFYQPSLVAIDTQVLKTLPPRQLFAGYAEVVKYGLIKDCSFFDWLELNGKKVLEGDKLAQQFAIFTSCRIKAEIVEADEKEQDLRAILNFGHTFGHALEAEAGYNGNLLHGEAVSIGMVMAIELSKNLGHLSGQDAGRAVEYIRSIGLPTNINSIEGSNSWHPDGLIQHMQHDKKVSNGQLRFVLIKGIGDAYLTSDVEKKQVFGVLEKSLSGDL
ncbi:3-dehydroquinate synthase [Rhodospirillaceae bacterium]|nr:3-dehydroquinate synthase [Rhodospirillaceae bacterium]